MSQKEHLIADIERKNIDWSVINSAINYYKFHGYEYIEVPWWVSKDTLMITCPDENYAFNTGDQFLVGSAEQAFLHLDSQNKIDREKYYVACTPCFRNEVENDDYHHKTFMKVELFIGFSVNQKTDEELMEIKNKFINDAYEFFKKYLELFYTEFNIEIVDTPAGQDIMLNGIELGSYGIRSHGDLIWIYGTGVAEPRFSFSAF